MIARTTDRLILNQLTDNDTPELFGIMSDPQNMRYWLSGPVHDIVQMRLRIVDSQASWRTHGFGDWAIRSRANGELLGFCGLHYVEGITEVNLGFVFDKSCWGKGYGSEASLAAIAFGFEVKKLDLIVGVIDPENLAAARILQKSQMTYWKNIVRKESIRAMYRVERIQWHRDAP